MTRSSYVVLGDWGTTRLRLYLARGDTIHDRCTGPGIGALSVPPLQALCEALKPWRGAHPLLTRVVLCGMAGSRNGLREASYLPLPAELRHWARHPRSFDAEGLAISIGAGLRRDDSGVADVMRGEETQVFGALGIDPALQLGRHWVVLPGTHSKWVHLEDSSIVAFTTFITGELFGLLKDHSTLLRAAPVAAAVEGMAGGGNERIAGNDRIGSSDQIGGGDRIGGERGFAVDPGIEGREDVDGGEGFETGVQRSQQRASGLAAAVFEARSAQLIHGRSHGWAREFLSGLLIGSEVRAALEYARAARVATLIGDPRLTALYRRALAHYATESVELDGDRCAIAGLLLLANSAIEEP